MTKAKILKEEVCDIGFGFGRENLEFQNIDIIFQKKNSKRKRIIRITDYRTIVLGIYGSASANLKVFVKGGIGDTRPDFAVQTNERAQNGNRGRWDYVEVIDTQNGAAIDGDTGVSLSGNVIRQIEVNANGLDWLSVHSTAVVAGTCTVVGLLLTNE